MLIKDNYLLFLYCLCNALLCVANQRNQLINQITEDANHVDGFPEAKTTYLMAAVIRSKQHMFARRHSAVCAS